MINYLFGTSFACLSVLLHAHHSCLCFGSGIAMSNQMQYFQITDQATASQLLYVFGNCCAAFSIIYFPSNSNVKGHWLISKPLMTSELCFVNNIKFILLAGEARLDLVIYVIKT